MADNSNTFIEWFKERNVSVDLLEALINASQNQVAITNEEVINEIDENEENENDNFISTEFNIDHFIEAVRELPSLWDVNHPTYKDRLVKVNAWKKLALIFCKEEDLLQKKLKNLKDTLRKCLDKRNRMTRSGAAASNLPKCKFFDQMTFLHEKSANKPTESNVDIVPDVASPSSFHSQCSFTKSSPSTSSFSSELILTENRKRLSHTRSPIQKKARIKNQNDESLSQLSQSLVECDKILKKSMEDGEEDETTLFCRSLIPIMKELPIKENRRAMIKIKTLLFNMK
ncbi:uncharacterized protein LOC124819091 [Hydra vulgaris]|uniref:uncharacterized protein LOC124819091 n=1 Tax=Hydra vulgaris TaxID=6087 RepID=UPI001F5F5DD9|nr:uncharacterized protein LOC124819091 [Hydra vulgaris]